MSCDKKAPSQNHVFHTTPDCWEKPRTFQMTANYSSDMWKERISFGRHSDWVEDDREKIYSPNDAYWFQKGFTEEGTFQVVIYNEKHYITIDTTSDDHYSKDVKWINEKLVYVRDWCGKVGGLDLIYDVEKEEVLYFEQIDSGTIPFNQWANERNKITNQSLKTED
ncbi:MAG: hypothetical protein ACYSUT_04780 [Planctomycetota bacterium]